MTKYGFEGTSGWPKKPTQAYGCSLWRGIMANITAVKEGISCRLGDGAKIQFWKDKWIGSEPLCSQFPEVYRRSRRKLGRVQDFRVRNEFTTEWNLHLRRRGNEQERAQVDELKQMLTTVLYEEGPDYWHWDLDKNGVYTVWKELTVTEPSVFLSLFTVDSLKEWLLAWPKKTGAELTIKIERDVLMTIWYWCGAWGGRRNFNFREFSLQWDNILKGNYNS
ncbi:hypothetical protein FRX31_016271 [Thalictrum thalictroides]|uniref:Uncharacterized protein n=1 Tax=Thalictrum thalictroides TaxID=46969 RepID=A0A7J6WD55_THATH|nr:hypothetical protein FRX31_016271 [Thalictrum thalictroides]